MKKILILCLTILMTLSLVACSQKVDEQTNDAKPSVQQDVVEEDDNLIVVKTSDKDMPVLLAVDKEVNIEIASKDGKTLKSYKEIRIRQGEDNIMYDSEKESITNELKLEIGENILEGAVITFDANDETKTITSSIDIDFEKATDETIVIAELYFRRFISPSYTPCNVEDALGDGTIDFEECQKYLLSYYTVAE